MHRFAVVPVLALLFGVACENSVMEPGRLDPAVPSFQEGPSDVQCVATLPPGVYQNVIVPTGTFCLLTAGVNILGNLKALERSTLVTFNVNVAGNVEGDKANAVQINFGTVGSNIHIHGANVPGPIGPVGALVNFTMIPNGNIQIEKNVTLGVLVLGSTLTKGNVKIEENLFGSPFFGLQVTRNQVGGNMQIFKNRGPMPKTVTGNTVREDLQCFENDPPFVAALNVARQAQGQCGAGPLVALSEEADTKLQGAHPLTRNSDGLVGVWE